MTYKLAWRSLLCLVLTSSLPFAGCARSAIEELDDASFAISDGGDEPEQDAEPGEEPDAEAPAEDASAPPAKDAGGDAAAQDAGAATDSGASAEAGAADAGAADAAMDAARDAAPDAAPADAAPPADSAPPADTAPPAPTCTAGNYRGVFMGSVVVEVLGFELLTIGLTGTIGLTAVAEPGTARLAVTNGQVMGQDDTGNPISATVTGSLNCATGKVDDGRLSEGRYSHWALGEVTFTGNVTGTYTNTPPYANGNWQTETASTTLLRGGMGTWNVSLVP